MEKFLGIVLIIIFSLVVLKWVMRLVLPLLLPWLMKKFVQRTFGHTVNFEQPGNEGSEGDVKVTFDGQQPHASRSRDKGEYVDFEDIKE